jgi:hypothetical protein
LVEQSVRKLINAGFTAEPMCQLGKPAEEIMKIAAKHLADLIVTGAQGLGAFDRGFSSGASRRGWCRMRPVLYSSFDDTSENHRRASDNCSAGGFLPILPDA